MVDKLVGTLGSITQRKVSEIFTVIKIKQSELKESERRSDMPDIYFRVKQNKARGRDVDDWYFEYVTNAGGWGQPVEIECNGERLNDPNEARLKQEREQANNYFGQYQWTSSGARYTDLERFLRTMGVTSNRKIQDLFNIAMEAGIIYKTDNRKYHYRGINKEVPNDEPENMFTTETEVPF